MALALKIDNWLLEDLKKIQAKLGAIYAEIQDLSPTEKDFLQKHAFISNIGASTRIENALLTDEEVEWIDTVLSEDARPSAFDSYKDLIFDKLSKDKERSIEEVVGSREMLEIVYSGYREMLPLRETDIRALHGHLLRHYPKAKRYCGKYKPNTNQVVMLDHDTGSRTVVLDPASPGPITDAAMRDLVDWYNAESRDCPWTLLLASEFTFRFLAIHPFQDGNGRLSRALFLLILLQSGDKYLSEVSKYISIDRHIEQARSAYYLALRQGSNGKFRQDPKRYTLEPITAFFVRSFDKALADVQTYKSKFMKLNQLTELEQKILQAFKASPEKKLRVSDIAEAVGVTARSVQKSIKNLMHMAFLQKLGRGPQTRYRLVF